MNSMGHTNFYYHCVHYYHVTANVIFISCAILLFNFTSLFKLIYFTKCPLVLLPLYYGTGVSVYFLYILHFILFLASCFQVAVSPSVLINLLSIILFILFSSYLISKQDPQKTKCCYGSCVHYCCSQQRK